MEWRSELGKILEKRARASRAELENAQFEAFMREVAAPALNEVANELNVRGRTAIVTQTPAAISLSVSQGAVQEILFRILRRSAPTCLVAYAEVTLSKGQRRVKQEGNVCDGNVPVEKTTSDHIIACFLKYYGMLLDTDL